MSSGRSVQFSTDEHHLGWIMVAENRLGHEYGPAVNSSLRRVLYVGRVLI